MVFFPLRMHIMYQFINEYDICNVVVFFFFLQSIVFKDMDLELEFFEAAIIVQKLPLPKNIKCDKQ